MSAPLVVNTRDGACWTRRTVTAGGIALYAPEAVQTCPEFVMATLEDLAAHGIQGSADALPMPVGPEPQVLSAGAVAKVAELIGDAKPASDGLLLQLGESVRDRREHEHPKWEDLFCLNLVSFMGERMGPVLRRLLNAEARVSDLEAELYTARAHNRTLLEQRNAHAKELLELRPQLESARALGRRVIHAEQRRAELEAVIETHRQDDAARIDRLTSSLREATEQIARLESDLGGATARVAELEAARKQTTAHVEHLAKTLVARTEDLLAADEQRTALAARLRAGQRWQEGRTQPLVSQDFVSQDELRAIFGIELTAPWEASEAKPAAVCRCGEPGADPYACEADDCKGEFSELNLFGGARPVNEPSAEVSRKCDRCGWRTSVWHVDDGSAEAELHEHTVRAHSSAEAGEPS